MGPRALVLALLPTAAAALRYNDKGTELGPIVGGTAGVLIFLFVIYHKWYKYRTRSTTVTAPAGKAGLLFDATATPPTVTGLAALSPLRGEVQVGWRLEKVDDVGRDAASRGARRQRASPRIRSHPSSTPGSARGCVVFPLFALPYRALVKQSFSWFFFVDYYTDRKILWSFKRIT